MLLGLYDGARGDGSQRQTALHSKDEFCHEQVTERAHHSRWLALTCVTRDCSEKQEHSPSCKEKTSRTYLA
eukprot:2550758-Amphidinium_carterae.1